MVPLKNLRESPEKKAMFSDAALKVFLFLKMHLLQITDAPPNIFVCGDESTVFCQNSWCLFQFFFNSEDGSGIFWEWYVFNLPFCLH